uniref:Uncharacterized protein n=1 Tax=Lepeophtheirus salmonis TaxID=72036 RepID=A0A0K2TB44_LEPSM
MIKGSWKSHKTYRLKLEIQLYFLVVWKIVVERFNGQKEILDSEFIDPLKIGHATP